MNDFEIIENEPNSICTICLDKQGIQKIQLECSHKIHPLCLKQWLLEAKEKTCPCCKKKLISYNIKCHICKEIKNSYKLLSYNNNLICIECIS